MTVPILIVAGALGALIYALRNAPRRYRRFGSGEQQEAVDNAAGQFGKTYPEGNLGTPGTSV